jgi:hypothetical protein
MVLVRAACSELARMSSGHFHFDRSRDKKIAHQITTGEKSGDVDDDVAAEKGDACRSSSARISK